MNDYDWLVDLAIINTDHESSNRADRLQAFIESLLADLDTASARIEEWVQHSYESDERANAANARADEAEAKAKWVAHLAAIYGKRLAVKDRASYYTDEAAILDRAAREAVRR